MKKRKKIFLGLLIVFVVALASLLIANLILSAQEEKSPISIINYPEEVTTKCLEKGKTCTLEEIIQGIAVSVAVNDKKIENFYVISNDENTMTLLSENNIIEDAIWYHQPGNFFGPNSLIINLSNATHNWTNIDVIQNYKYEDSGYQRFRDICITKTTKVEGYDCDSLDLGAGYSKLVIENGNVNVYTEYDSYFPFEGEKVRVRTITKEEVEYLINNAQKPIAWLSISKPFWTLTSAVDKVNGYITKAYVVQNTEFHPSAVALFPYKVNTEKGIGIRAVITIPKVEDSK
ncbi:MAG: hypothetical protein E7164_03125 [Firmicutes bacterium]|nr:hypothetical protein [Bacillota bacterium]